MLLGVVRAPLHVRHFPYTSPCMGVPPLQLHPTKLLTSLSISRFQGYWYVIWGFSPSVGVWGCSLSIGGAGGISTWDVHMLILVVCYVSHFYYGYDYYSSSYHGIFWPVFGFISDHGSFPDRVSSKLGSVGSGSTTTLDAERLGRCYWHCLCATAATSIFNAPSGLCQLSYGFSTGRFLFQS